MSQTTPTYTEHQVEDKVLAELVAALRSAQVQAPYSAQHLALSAYLAVYGLAGVAAVASALRSS